MGPEAAQQFIEEVLPSADPARAERDRQYHKSTRQHWGITMPQLDNVVKRHARQHPPPNNCCMLQLSSKLRDSGIYDLMTAAGRILGRREITASPELWQTLGGWTLEGLLAPVAWKCLLHDAAVMDDLERWTTHPDK